MTKATRANRLGHLGLSVDLSLEEGTLHTLNGTLKQRAATKAVGLLLFLATVARAECLPCGPDYCHGDPRYPSKLAAKKKALTDDGYPGDLVALLDRGGECVARVEQAPDGFSMKVIEGNSALTFQWSVDDERIARENLLKGRIDRYYKFNTDRAFVCCSDKKPEERPDWDTADG